MKKEKLEKEAKKSCIDKTHYCIGGFGGDAYCEGYIDSAEPREKQIEIDAEQIRALQKQNGELTDRVNEATEIIIDFLVEKTQNVYTPKEWESLIAKAEAFLKEIKEK